jgi:hypothetical protein
MDPPAHRRVPSSTGGRGAILAAIVTLQALTCSARAADLEEFWPELSAFYQLNPSARVYFDGSYSKGKESDQLSLDAAAYLDVSLQPILRTELQSEDWQRNRYLWSRIGYTRVFDVEGGGSREVKEDRGVVALYGRAPLRDVVLEARARVDLRWIGGDYSNRYRIRIDASREFGLLAHTVVPYLNAEWFYDTRYDAWARTLFQGGVEVTETKRFRYEIYLARQNDHKPSDKTLNALGVVLKWYF